MKHTKHIVSTLSALALAVGALTPVAAAQKTPESVAAPLKAALAKSMPGIMIEAVEKTPILGLYQIIAGGEVAYVTTDGQYMLQGTLYNVPKRKNLTEGAMTKTRVAALERIDQKALVIYPAEGEAKYTVTAFVDPSCPYCSSMHHITDEYTKRGITVRYAFYPLDGSNGNATKQMQDIVCSADSKKALDWYFSHAREPGKGASCDLAGQVAVMTQVARDTGLQGTPHIVSSDGDVFAGYKAPDELLKALDEAARARP